ncbi:hypothetical protein EW146_g2451 [Bondarzewia mesenterica]|uniref:C3H1-type domain-containing protein n=1 Tax=Bondarzewia mesenterica TaxID=1095465 RepID=A0A4S4M226_9AGAM|nr:hypothetical protein EW146_g2451 [Bondarzewia mesenterica]
MVSELWKASSEGDLAKVNELLAQAAPADVEINGQFSLDRHFFQRGNHVALPSLADTSLHQDQDGVTPLIEAVKNSHYDVVKALLDRGMQFLSPLPYAHRYHLYVPFPGADPNHASSQGVPEQYTSDPAILDLLREAGSAKTNTEAFHPQPVYPHDPNVDPSKGYYIPPPGPYAYYPGMPVPPLPDGAVPYYPPPPPPADDQHPQGGLISNLPPPEIARLIPCRYFPACRYGASCMFAHPQGPYYQGPMPPPAQYPAPYDPMNPHPYPPNFYPMPPPSFQPPNGIPPPLHLTPMSPQPGPHSAPPMVHARSGSEIMSPAQGPFSPTGAQAPVPYGAISPVSPSYPHPVPTSVPLPVTSLPPVNGGPQSPVYQPPSHPMSNYDPRRDSGQYPAQPTQRGISDTNGMQKPAPFHGPEGFGPGGHRDGMGHHRRGSFRRQSFGGRKPPCLFFPSGRCRNGDECRFPHVMPDTAPPHQPNFAGRGGRFRPPPFVNGNANSNGIAPIEEQLAAMNVNDDNAPPQENIGGAAEAAASRVRTPSGPKQFNHAVNGPRPSRPSIPKQRVPNADEFPVLGGSTTPPSRSPAFNGHVNGPTAAQVLQAPPPARKDSTKDSSSRSQTPDSFRAAQPQQVSKPASEAAAAAPVVHQDRTVNKLPVSFAAVANGAPDASKEITVSA